MDKMLIGWAEESLVPEKKVSVAGQFFERISEYVESEITATAMAVECNGEQLIMISADLVGMPNFVLNMTREKFAKMCNEVDPMKIVLAVTHTHCSHTLVRENAPIAETQKTLNEFLPADNQYQPLVKPDDSVITGEEATEFVTDQLALAAKKAWDNRDECYYTNEFGRAAVGMCRRVVYDDNTAQMWGDVNTANFDSLEGGNDSGVELLYVFDKNKKLTGIVANIACPAQILEQRSFISADYWGRAKNNIREKLGKDIYLLGVCGAAGDQCPRDLVRWVDPETPIDDPNVKRPNPIKRKADPSMYDVSGCNRVGKRIANEIVSVYEEITELQNAPILEHKVATLNLPLRKATMTEYNEAVRELKAYIAENKGKEFNFDDLAKMYVYVGTINRFREQQNKEIFPTEAHVIRLGNIAFATNPFELFLDYGNRMKARSYAEQTFVVQLCNGMAGYLPTAKAEEHGHYSAYISSGNVGHIGGDILTRWTIEEINKMFKK